MTTETQAFGPWVNLRYVFGRLDALVGRAKEHPISIISGSRDWQAVEAAKKFFENMALYTEALRRAGPGPFDAMPAGPEFDDVLAYLRDYAVDDDIRFYDSKESLKIVAILGEVRIRGYLVPVDFKKLGPLVASIPQFAVNQTSTPFDKVEIDGKG